MTCWKKRTKKVEKKYQKKNKVRPLPEFNQEFVDKFVKEVIYCGGCKEPFSLGSNELKIHCNLCNKFFHCKIAGECIGKDCKVQLEDGSFHRASYCVDCVAKISGKNTCLCKDCSSK